MKVPTGDCLQQSDGIINSMYTPQEPSQTSYPETTASIPPTPDLTKARPQTGTIVGIVVVIVLILAGIGVAIYFLAQPATDTERVRDIFIILMALQSLLIGVVLLILVYQLTRLINLLQNEIKPILDSTNETASTLRGTARFLSDNLAEPVMKLNEYLAGFQKLVGLVKPSRSKPKK